MPLLDEMRIKHAVQENNHNFISTYFTPEKLEEIEITAKKTFDDDKSKFVEEFHNTFLRFACSSNAVSPSTMRLVLEVAEKKLNILPALFEHPVKKKKPTPLYFAALYSAQVETLKVLVEEYLLRYRTATSSDEGESTIDCFTNMLLKAEPQYNPIHAVCRTTRYDSLKYLLEVMEKNLSSSDFNQVLAQTSGENNSAETCIYEAAGSNNDSISLLHLILETCAKRFAGSFEQRFLRSRDKDGEVHQGRLGAATPVCASAFHNSHRILVLCAYYSSQSVLLDDLYPGTTSKSRSKKETQEQIRNSKNSVEYYASDNPTVKSLIDTEEKKNNLLKYSIRMFHDRFGHYPTNDRVAGKMLNYDDNDKKHCVIQ